MNHFMIEISARKRFREYCKEQDKLRRKEVKDFANGYVIVMLGLPVLLLVIAWIL